MGLNYYLGELFEYQGGGTVHPDTVKICHAVHGRPPTDHERETIRARVKDKLRFLYQTEKKVPADEENMKKIDTLLRELIQELKQETKKQ
jgi:hypothetical protein